MQAEFAKIRRHVSLDQILVLLRLIRGHPELYTAMLRPTLDGAMRVFWNKCAEKLNFIKGGAFKDAYGWTQYWRYWKYRVKQRTVELTSNKPRSKVPEDDYVPLAALDKVILSLLRQAAHEVEDDNDGSDPIVKQPNTKDTDGKNDSASTSNADTARFAGFRKRRYSATDIDNVEREKLTPLDPTQRYHEDTSSASTSAPPIRKKRRAFSKASKAIEKYFKSKPLKKKASGAAKRARGHKSQRPAIDSEDSEDTSLDNTAAAIRRRRYTFSHMSDAVEQVRESKLELQAAKVRYDPEYVEQLEVMRRENAFLVYNTLRIVAMESLTMVAILNTGGRSDMRLGRFAIPFSPAPPFRSAAPVA